MNILDIKVSLLKKHFAKKKEKNLKMLVTKRIFFIIKT